MFLDEPVRLQESAEIVEKEYFHSLESREEAGMETEEIPIQVEQTDHTIGKMNKYYGIAFTMLESKCGMFKVRSVYSLQVKTVNPYNSSFELLTRDLKKLKRTGYRVILVSGSRTRAKRLAEDLVRKRKKRKEKLMKEKKSRNLPNLNRETMWYMRITDLEFIRGLRKSK